MKAFHEAALALGAPNEGDVGPRDWAPNAFAAYTRDPDGNKLAVTASPLSKNKGRSVLRPAFISKTRDLAMNCGCLIVSPPSLERCRVMGDMIADEALDKEVAVIVS